MLRIGLTGGIAAGKSTVSGRLSELGATIVDADLLAREVVEPGTPGLAAVVEAFGPGVLLPDGRLDRPALGRIVFDDAEQLARLNGILHPLIGARSQELIAAAEQAATTGGSPGEGTPGGGPGAVLVHDIPLLVENNAMAGFDLVMVVYAPEAERLRRLIEDRGMSEHDALARIRAQADDDQRRAAADIWIDNSGSREDTIAQVDAAWQALPPG
jgi:dephospho-CoA kinase